MRPFGFLLPLSLSCFVARAHDIPSLVDKQLPVL